MGAENDELRRLEPRREEHTEEALRELRSFELINSMAALWNACFELDSA
jgi:hypothetical protein